MKSFDTFHIENRQAGTSARIGVIGAAILELHTPDRNGTLQDVVLGYADQELYRTNPHHFGVIAGRYANRIADGKFELAGQIWQLDRNNEFGDCIHGGMAGFHLQVFTLQELRSNSVTLQLEMPDGAAGFPGTMNLAITYTLTVKNTLAYRRAVTLESVITDSVSFVSGNVDFTVDGNNLTADVIISPFTSYTFTWTVAVNADAKAGALAQCNTSLGGVSLMEFRSTVSEFTEAEMALVVAKAREFAEDGRSFTDPALMVEALYNEALGIANIYSFDDTQDLLASFTYYNESNGYYYYDAESELVGVMAPNLYGGFDITYPNFYRDKNIVRLITRDHISVGDATIASDSGKEVAFIYLGGQDFLYVDSVDMECKIVTMTDSPFEPSNILVTFFAYDRYVTIRPSMVAR